MSMSSIWWRCGQNFIDKDKIYICFIDKDKTVLRKAYDLVTHRMEEFISEFMPSSQK